MRFFATLIFIAIAFSASAQSYSVECPKPDSCFLKEISVGPVSAQNPRPQTVVSYTYFRGPEELQKIVDSVRKQAAEQLEKGMQIVNTANSMNAAAKEIEALLRPKK